MTHHNVRAVVLAGLDFADRHGLVVEGINGDNFGTATLYCWSTPLEDLDAWFGGQDGWRPWDGEGWRGYRGDVEVRPGWTLEVRVIASTTPMDQEDDDQ